MMMTEQTKPDILQPADSFIEQKKNQLLGALYENDYPAFEHFFAGLLRFIQKTPHPDEYSEKLLTQVKTILRRFRAAIEQQCSPEFFTHQNHLKKYILNSIKQSSMAVRHVTFQEWENRIGLNNRQKKLLYKTTMTFQLTSGCSNYCRRCNEWALPKVRSHFSYEAVLIIMDQLVTHENEDISLYGASDPLDWQEDGKTISDVIDAVERLTINYNILTKIPRGKETTLKTLVGKHANLAVSMTKHNKTRIKKIEHDLKCSLSKQHDLDDLLIPAGLDEDFVTIKPSITDGYGVEITPDAAYIIIPAFTSALHPFGHKKLEITSSTTFFPVKKTGRNALLVDYFKPLDGYDLDQKRTHLTHLLDVQIESILLDNGTDELTPPGMRSLKEYLSIFEEKARIQRHKMTPSILRHLKKKEFKNTPFKRLSHEKKQTYLKKIHRHFDLCKEKKCRQLKCYAVSFFLASIFDYVKRNPEKIKTIQFLLKREIQSIFASYANTLKGRSPDTVLADTRFNAFDIFRFFAFCLLTRSNHDNIMPFIQSFASVYDPISDLFVGA